MIKATVLALYVAAALTALAVSRRDRQHRPVAVYLCAVLALDALRTGLEVYLLPPLASPYQGWQLAVRHLDQGAYLALLLAGPALAVAVFCARRIPCSRPQPTMRSPPKTLVPGPWWPIAGAWAALWLVGWLGYPELRGDALLECYSAVEAAGAVVALLLFARWAWRHPELLAVRGAPLAAKAAVILLGASLVVSALPSLAGAETLAQWPAIVGVTGVALAAVLCLQLQALIHNRDTQHE